METGKIEVEVVLKTKSRMAMREEVCVISDDNKQPVATLDMTYDGEFWVKVHASDHTYRVKWFDIINAVLGIDGQQKGNLTSI